MNRMALWLTLLRTGFQLFLSSDALIEIRGTLHPNGVPSSVEIKCYFPLEALDMHGLSIKQERRRYTDPPGLQFTTMSFISDNTNNGKVLNLLSLGGTSSVSGSLREGLAYTMGLARCQDAGIYRCAFSYMAVQGGVYVVPNSKLEDAVLDVYPTIVHIGSESRTITFDDVTTTANITLDCRVFTTVNKATWVWQTRTLRNGGAPWSAIDQGQVVDSIPPPRLRCSNPLTSRLTVPVTMQDRNRQFTCFVRYSKGQSRRAIFSVKDIWPTQRPMPSRLSFERPLTIAGWVILPISLILILLMVVHAMYPNLVQSFRPSFLLLMLRRRGRRGRQETHHQQDEIGAREHDPAPAPTSSNSAPPPRPRNRHRRLQGSPMLVAAGAAVDASRPSLADLDPFDQKDGSHVDVGCGDEECDNPGADGYSVELFFVPRDREWQKPVDEESGGDPSLISRTSSERIAKGVAAALAAPATVVGVGMGEESSLASAGRLVEGLKTPDVAISRATSGTSVAVTTGAASTPSGTGAPECEEAGRSDNEASAQAEEARRVAEERPVVGVSDNGATVIETPQTDTAAESDTEQVQTDVQ